MRNFSIKDLERFTGIKAHTIRIWETRYATLQPERGKGQVRNYTLDDVKHLLNITLLAKQGLKVSSLSRLSKNDIEHKVNALKTNPRVEEKVINSLIICMFSNNIEEFETILDSCTFSWGIDVIIKQVIIPFLEKVQILSYKDKSTEAHFVVTAIRRKIILGIEKSSPDFVQQKTALLFLPKDEHYDLLLLYIAYTLKSYGLRVLYLGTDISPENLESVSREKKPDLIYTYVSLGKGFKLDRYKKIIHDHKLQTKLFVTTHYNNVSLKEKTENVMYVHYNDINKTF